MKERFREMKIENMNSTEMAIEGETENDMEEEST